MKNLTNILKFNNADKNTYQLLLIAMGVFLVMSLLNSDRFLTFRNFTSMSYQFPELGLFALAIMLSLVSGGIDLSIVSSANLAGILAALILVHTNPPAASGMQVGWGMLTAITIAISTGLLCGAINGFLIANVGITPILATLGTMQLYLGISYVVTRGPAVYGFPSEFLYLGNGLLFFFPMPLVIFCIIAVMASVLMNKTSFGLNLYMLGTNETAARFSGIRVRLLLFKTYILTGFLSGVTGIIMIARTNSAKADYGSSYLLQAVLVAVLGGTNPNGGFGTISGLVLAVITLQLLSSGFNMLRFSNFAKEFTWGMLLLIVMMVNYPGNKKYE